MVRAGEVLSLAESEALNCWIESGNKRSEWLGWKYLIGEKPAELSTVKRPAESVGSVHLVNAGKASS